MEKEKMRIDVISEKGGGEINEDAYLIKKNLFGVFDGATGLIKFKNKQGKTGGLIAASIAKKFFSKNLTSFPKTAKKANNAIYDEMIKNKIAISKEANWCTSIAVVRLEEERLQYVQISDSIILIVYKNGTYQIIPKKYEHDLQTLLKWKKLAELKTKHIREKLKHQLIKVRNLQNIKYGVLNGEKSAMKFINSGKVSTKNADFILLFTDGFMIPKENPKMPDDFKLMIQSIEKKGIKGLLYKIRQMEKTDPHCWKYPRFKQHDDATAILIKFP